jgi:hypothetical protein
MDRPSVRRGMLAALVLTLALLPMLGCQGLLLTAMYFWNGNDVPPEFPGLKGKKVAVVWRCSAGLQYSNANAGRELAKQISLLLKEKVPKIDVIDHKKVAKWADGNNWEEFIEVGKAMKADMVVGIELEHFSLYEGQTLYQGNAGATVQVYDCSKGGEPVYEKNLARVLYPPSTPIPASEMPEVAFRREFTKVLADQIARHFYAHDRYADTAQDATILQHQYQ